MVIIEIINSDFESLPFTFILNAPVLFWKLTACLCVPRTRQLSSKIVREFKNLNLPGVGLGKAKNCWQKVSNPDLRTVLRKLPAYLKMPGLIVTQDYIEKFIKANN